MKVHFIAIGGSVMHNLAIALHKKGYQVSGSDDQIFDPARSRLAQYHLLPEQAGWYPERIHKDLDAVILGMHAKEDNPELLTAQKLSLPIWSFPEYLYAQTKNKKRVVVGGSHGKTTITSMIMHVLRHAGIPFDYMVGAQIEGFETMVGLHHDSELAVFEGDEYLSSPLDRTPKFHLYKPHIAVMSGIAWDHINVFPTFENYLEQFSIFTGKIEPGGVLIHYGRDVHTQKVAGKARDDILKIPYQEHPLTTDGKLVARSGEKIPFNLIGTHNAANVQAALEVTRRLDIPEETFYDAIRSFKGAARRLQKIGESKQSTVFLDFAHAPSKLKATIEAVKNYQPARKLVACMELHTFSSLNKAFIKQYKGTMDEADIPIVYFNPQTIKQKNLDMLSKADVKTAFGNDHINVYDDARQLYTDLKNLSMKETNMLLMTSGNFNGIDLRELAGNLLHGGEEIKRQ